jgi:NAD(P)-dependent dehydrogenase (short-subunit alcohol dehydrogenase family)
MAGAVRRARLDLDDLQSVGSYDPLGAYGRAKLMNLAWTLDLAHRLEPRPVGMFAANPGMADTGTHRDYPWPAPTRAVMFALRPLLHRLLSAEKAAASSIRAATALDLEGKTGLVLGRTGNVVDPPEAARRRGTREIVDRISRDLTRLGPEATRAFRAG